MSKNVKVDDEVMTEEEFDHRLDVAHWQGQADSLAAVMGKANSKAGDYFAAQRDDEAQKWREFAGWLRMMFEEAQRNYESVKNRVEDDEDK